jgi:hypothetical protein
MKSIKISLVDNDYVVRAKTEVVAKENTAWFENFINELKEGLVPGETALLEIEGLENECLNFEICTSE